MNQSTENNIFLNFFANTSKRQRIAIIQTLTANQLRLFTEIIYNIIRGNISLSDIIKSKLKRNKNGLRKVIARTLSRKERKRKLLDIQNCLPLVIKTYLNHESRDDFNTEEEIREHAGITERDER